MLIIEDDRQKIGKHCAKNRYWLDNGWRVVRARLPFGDYALYDDINIHNKKGEIKLNTPFGRVSFAPLCVVDTKADINELAQNLQRDHKRFRAECIRAKDAGVQLVILTESEHVNNLSDLHNWLEPLIDFNTRNGKKRYRGKTLARICSSMTEKYGVYFDFVKPCKAGQTVIEKLKGGEEWMKKKTKS